MKIHFKESGSLVEAIKRKVLGEGDEWVPEHSADLVFGRDVSITPWRMTKEFIEGLGLTTSNEKPKFYLSKVFSDGWSEQTMFSVGTYFVGNEDTGGEDVEGTSWAMRFVPNNFFAHVFDNEGLSGFAENGFRGVITVGMNTDGVCEVWTGIPGIGIFNFLEAVKGKISEWFMVPRRLMESWTVGTLISQFPYPCVMVDSFEPVALGVNPQIDKHLWMLDVESKRKQWYSTSGRIAVATGFGATLYDAKVNSLRSVRALRFLGVQYRTDIDEVAGRIWASLEI